MKRMLSRVLLPLACLVAAAVGWRIFAVYQADRLAQTAPGDALRWNARDPNARLALAREQLRDNQPQRAAATARALLKSDPLEAEALVILARVAEINHDPATKALFSLALKRAPRDPYARAWLIGTQLHDGEYDAALANVDTLVATAYPRLRVLEPAMASLADKPAFAGALLRALRQSPPWRAEFLAYVLAHCSHGAIDSIFGGLQRDRSLSDAEAGAWFDYLTHAGRWGEAYSRWASGLHLDPGTPLALVYNGGFESEATGVGFDWRMPGAPGVLIERTRVAGAQGGAAAQVTFFGRRSTDLHFAQTVLLGPGRYRLHFRASARGLLSDAGLAWAIRCHGSTVALAASPRLQGSFDWTDVTADFVVPARDCPAQELALVNPGAAGTGAYIEGTIWFDDFAIEGLESADAHPDAAATTGQ